MLSVFSFVTIHFYTKETYFFQIVPLFFIFYKKFQG